MKVNEGLETKIPLASEVLDERRLALADNYRRIVGEVAELVNSHRAILAHDGEVEYTIKDDDETTVVLFKQDLFSLFRSRGYRVVLQGLFKYEQIIISIRSFVGEDEPLP